MDPIEELVAIQAIKTLKATYWYAVDTKNWEMLATVFSDDCILDMRGERAHALGAESSDLGPLEVAIAQEDPAICIGAQAITRSIRSAVEHWVTVHQGSAPIIRVQDRESATAIWPFFDFIDDGTRALQGYGHYHELYRRTGDTWFTTYLSITRLRTDGEHPWGNQP